MRTGDALLILISFCILIPAVIYSIPIIPEVVYSIPWSQA